MDGTLKKKDSMCTPVDTSPVNDRTTSVESQQLKAEDSVSGAMQMALQPMGAINGSASGAADDAVASTLQEKFAPFARKMSDADLPAVAIRSFEHYYQQLLAGESGCISAEQAEPVAGLPTTATIDEHHAAGVEALTETAVIKLNGGLGTTMGMTGPKSLIRVKDGLTFLDIIVRQVLKLRADHNASLPLVLMDSYNTQQESLAALAQYPELQQAVPLDFLQHRIPKIWQATLDPVSWPANRELEWCPPGHGDLYLALQTSGMLDQLLDAGYTYAFVSNSDNLGATVDLNILGYFAVQKLPFLMEVAARTAADRKGGHLAQNAQQGLILREVAQCPPEELADFQDIARYRYFNTNNLWINLLALKAMLTEKAGVLGLPLIRNEKPVDPTKPDSPPVYQLETAMGHAIALFDDAQAIQVERSRFLPVKSTSDLLALWSDAYLLDEDVQVRVNPQRTADEPLLVELDKRYFGLFADLQKRFPGGAPSLVDCTHLVVEGDLYFAPNLTFTGENKITNPREEPLCWPVE